MKKTRWDVLSVKDKASLIKLFVNNGVVSLKDMIDMYNTHTFSDGGDKDELELSGGVLPGATITSKKVEKRNTPGKNTFIPSNFIVPIEQPVERKAQFVNNYLVDQYNTIQEDIRDYLNNTTFLGDPIRTPNESLQYLKDLQDEQQYLEDLSAWKNNRVNFKHGGRLSKLVQRINETSNADFVKRLLDEERAVLKNEDGTVSTHELGYVTEGDKAVVFPFVQSTDNGLVRFTMPDAINRAVERGDTLQMSVPEAELFTKKYKKYYPGFHKYDGDSEPTGQMSVKKATEEKPSIIEKAVRRYLFGNKTDDKVRQALYDNLYPYDYGEVDMFEALNRVKSAAEGERDPRFYIHEGNFADNPKDDGKYEGGRDDIFATYLQIPEEKRHKNLRGERTKVSRSEYRPTIGGKNNEYYKINLTDDDKDWMLSRGLEIPIGKSEVSSFLGQYFGDHTLSHGIDERGEYISYYDNWDINPLYGRHSVGKNKNIHIGYLPVIRKLDSRSDGESFIDGLYSGNLKYFLGNTPIHINLPNPFVSQGTDTGDQSLGIGKPIHFYDRLYLDDYYGVDSKPQNPDEYYGGYLPPAIVTANIEAGGGLLKKYYPGFNKYDGNTEPTGQMMLIGEDGNPIDVLPGAVTTYNTLSDYNRRQIKKLARNDYANVGEKTREFDKDWQERVYNRAWNRADREYRNQENRKALRRAAIQELQTGVPTGAFNEYTKEGIEDMAPFAMGLVTTAAGPALGGLKTAGEVMRAAGAGYNTVNAAKSYALSNVARFANNTIGKTKLGSWGLKGAAKTLKLLENLAPSTHVQTLLDTIGVNHTNELYRVLPTIADYTPGLASYFKNIVTVTKKLTADTSEEEQKYKRRLIKDLAGLTASIALPIAGANVRNIHNASYVKNLIKNQKAFDSVTDRVGARLGSSQRADIRFIDTDPNRLGVNTLGTDIGLNPENLKQYSRRVARYTLAHEANHMHRYAIGDPLVDPQSWTLYGYAAPDLVNYPQYQKWYPDKTKFGQWGYSPEEVLSDIAGYKEIAGIADAGFSNLSKAQKRRLVRYIKTRGGKDQTYQFPKWNKKEVEGLLKQFEKDNIKFTNGGYLYKTGGDKNKRSVFTTLNKKREAEFQDWYSKVAEILNLDSNPDNQEHGYDYRGYWLENRKKDIDYSSPEFHFPDTWKQPWHETFSNESKYANMRYGINPKSVGHWEGDTFIPGVYNDIMGGRSPQSEFLKTKEWAEELIGPPKPSIVYTPSDSIIEYIKNTEGFSPVWYKDGNGIDTIGYGFTGPEAKKLFPNGITREQADKYFSENLAKRAKILQRDTPNWDVLNQNQRDSLLSYHYNIGEGSYRDKSPKMQKALREKDWKTVTENIDFGYNDSANRGLRKRRDYERALFNTPVETKTPVQYKCGGKLKRKNRIYVE